jgi:hypothetical protein
MHKRHAKKLPVYKKSQKKSQRDCEAFIAFQFLEFPISAKLNLTAEGENDHGIL